MKAKITMSFLQILLLAGAADAQETRTEFKKADLTGTKMEIWTAVYDFRRGRRSRVIRITAKRSSM